jgi:hypothetical protein
MHQKKDCALVAHIKININIIIYYSRIKKFDKEKNTLKFEKIDSNNESKGHTSWAYLLHS